MITAARISGGLARVDCAGGVGTGRLGWAFGVVRGEGVWSVVREELVLRLSWVNVVSSATQVIVQCTVYRTAKRRMRRAAICSRTIPSRNWRNTWKLQISACDQCLLRVLPVQSVKAVVKYISKT